DLVPGHHETSRVAATRSASAAGRVGSGILLQTRSAALALRVAATQLLVIRRHERRDVRRSARLAAAEVPRRAFTEELREPGFVFDLLIQDRRADGVGAVVLALGERADVAVGADGAALGLHQHGEQ